MSSRAAVFAARRWYPPAERACRDQLREMLSGTEELLPRELPRAPVGGLAPHAGWVYSGKTAAAVFRALGERVRPQAIVFFGSVHVPGVDAPTIWDGGAWETPIGPMEVARDLVEAILARCPDVVADEEPHREEHSVEVQLPFARHYWPDAGVAVLMVPPDERAPGVGRAAARAVRELGLSAIGVGSTDMTHYGPRYGFTPKGVGAEAHRWVTEENDRRMIERIAALDSAGVLAESRERHNACSAGAIAAVLAFASELGARRGTLLHYTTSHDARPAGPPVDFVGYSGFVFA
ncbi:MAG: AmmeMemoRadiSam system protein B [Planctomycetes bacterium]|nr:AmmeMemoRadiSam system protein B [Planctomycetota bacterium]